MKLENFDFEKARYVVDALERALGGKPRFGRPQSFVYSMALQLRQIYGADQALLDKIIPTYGETPEQREKVICAACTKEIEEKPSDLIGRVLEEAEWNMEENEYDPTSRLNRNEMPPALPEKLPPLIELLTSKVPVYYKPAVACAVFPPLGAHMHGVYFRYLDNVLHEPAFMSVLMAKMSTGKGCVNKPIEYIMADIEERDKINRQRENEWKKAMNTRGANKDKPQRPEGLCIQYLPADMTNAAFVQRLQDAGGRFLYTAMDELDLLEQLQTGNRRKGPAHIIRLAFDCAPYGQERVGAASVTSVTRLRWNWNASTTISKGRDFFKDSFADGTLSRLNFSTIVVPMLNDLPVYGIYDEAFADALKPYIDCLNEVRGEVHCEQALQLAKKMIEESRNYSLLTGEDGYEMLSRRAVVSAYLKAMTLYVAQGMQWTQEIADFALWSLRYDMWCKMAFFGEEIEKVLQKEKKIGRRGPANMLDVLQPEFTFDDAVIIREAQGKDPVGTKHMLSVWMNRGYITYNDDTKKYYKTAQAFK